MIFHRHRWEEARRYFTPPIARDVTVRGSAGDLFRELAQGVTVVELHCATCGDVKERRLAGDAT